VIPGAKYQGNDKCSFTVWAPQAKSVKLQLLLPKRRRILSLDKIEFGYWSREVEGIAPGSLYFYKLDDSIRRADPASFFQPKGVHGPSAVVDHKFTWTDSNWSEIPLEEMIIYELHVGTFTEEGTFEGIIRRLKYLKHLGINAIELMPVAQFPGKRNWGYDGVFPYAVQNSYGGPKDLKKLINACHRNGVAVIIDVVYNHLGPEGNYLRDFGPYFTDKYKTPWGRALNFDGPYSDHVRNFFFENALFWFREYHVDALRLDALHAIYDSSAKHFIEELAERVEKFSQNTDRKCYLIGESDLNDIRLIKPRLRRGYGLDAQWCDDFHHSLHALVTGECSGYYKDFGKIDDLAKAYKEGFVYSWTYSKYRKRHHGSSSKSIPAKRFVVCIQNHDQVGNRMLGERLSSLVNFEALKLAAGAVILSPYIPMLFMGEEYGEQSPFLYFVNHSDRELIEAIRRGRMEEFKSFQWKGHCPDPQALKTFKASKLNWKIQTKRKYKILFDFYRELITLRKSLSDFTNKKITVRSLIQKNILLWHRRICNLEIQCVLNFSDNSQKLKMYAPQKGWRKILDSADEKWIGPGPQLPSMLSRRQQVTIPPLSIALFQLKKKREVGKTHLREKMQSSMENVYAGTDSNV
jgi:maltooligosyltrehalose trehalohydrolase